MQRHMRSGNRYHRLAMLIAALAVIGATGARASEKANTPPSIWEQETLTGDWGGARTALKNKGIDVTLNYIGEAFAVMSGGLQRRASYEGRLEFSLDADLQKLIGWTGSTAHVTVFQIHDGGHNVIGNVGSIADPSNIEALPTTRLYTAWFQQNAFDDRVSLRIGQLAADDEFIASPTAGGLLSGAFGWATVLSANLPSGGPAYPLATPGVRVAVKPTEQITALAAVFSGDPAGSGCNDNPQLAIATAPPSVSPVARSGWANCNTPSIRANKPPGCRASTSLAAGTRRRISPISISGSTASGAVVSLADPTAVGPLNHRRQRRRLCARRPDGLALGKAEPQSVHARRLCAIRPQSDFVLRRRRSRPQRSAAWARRRHAHLRRFLRQDQPRRGGARPGHARAQRAALSDPQRRGVVRVELSGADRALVDRAAGPASHRPSRRQRAGSQQSQCRPSATPWWPASAARSNSDIWRLSAIRCRRAPRGSG